MQRQNEEGLGGIFIGNLVGSTFQDMVVSSIVISALKNLLKIPRSFT